MIEFNLLPDIKLEYIKTRRVKRMVMFVAVLATSVSLLLLIGLLLIVDGLQKKHLHDLNHDIASTKSQILAIPDIGKVLTVQNQLGALPSIDAQKPVTSRVFGYLQQIVPNSVSLNKANFDYTANSLDLSGNAESLASVNQFVDTLKFTTYSATSSSSGGNSSNNSSSSSSNSASKTPAFSKVVLSSFSLNGSAATYDIQASFDPVIFNVADTVTLTVPNITSTRSVTEQPTDLFQQPASTNTSSGH